MWILWVGGILAIAFGGGVATSYAEYRFKYSLYELLREKLTGSTKE